MVDLNFNDVLGVPICETANDSLFLVTRNVLSLFQKKKKPYV